MFVGTHHGVSVLFPIYGDSVIGHTVVCPYNFLTIQR